MSHKEIESFYQQLTSKYQKAKQLNGKEDLALEELSEIFIDEYFK